MMRRTIGWTAACAAILVTASARGLSADNNAEAKALFEKVDAQLYYPQDHGLKDLSCTASNNMMKMIPMAANIKMILLWKAPDKKALKMEGLDESNQMMAGLGGQMKKSMGRLLNFIVRVKRTDQLEKYDYTLSKDGALTKVTGALKEGKGSEGDPSTEAFWVDGKNRIAKMEIEVQGQTGVITDIKYVERGGKLLWESFTASGGGGNGGKQQSGTATFEYTQVKDLWLVSKMTQPMPQMPNMKTVMEFGDYKINEGIDDKEFIEEAAPKGDSRGDDSDDGDDSDSR